jgi:signal recognition particle receptor subunit beta
MTPYDSQGKPVAVVINKVDAPSVIGSKDIEHALMLPVLEGLGITLQVLHTSALTGDGASDFLQWIVEHAAIHNG